MTFLTLVHPETGNWLMSSTNNKYEFHAKMLSYHFVTKSWKSTVKMPCGSLGGG